MGKMKELALKHEEKLMMEEIRRAMEYAVERGSLEIEDALEMLQNPAEARCWMNSEDAIDIDPY